MGTGKEQSIKIESATSLSEDEIQEKIAEAEKFAEDDQRRRPRLNFATWPTKSCTKPGARSKSRQTNWTTATNPVKAHLDELEKMVQDDDGKPVDIDAMDDAAIQAKVKEIEEAARRCHQTLRSCAQRWPSKRAVKTATSALMMAWSMQTSKW